jgi:general nucleoside transport system permease protein
MLDETLPRSSPGADRSIGNALRLPRCRITLEVRQHLPLWQQASITAASILLGLVISGGILVAAGVAPSNLVEEFIVQILFDPQNLRAVLFQAAPLILVGLGATMAFRTRFWNLGIEGQMIWGGIAATAVSIYHLGPEQQRLILMTVAAVLAGMVWVTIPALLKMTYRVNEIISTLLLNYVSSYFLFHLLYGAWKDSGDSFPHSPQFTASERLPDIGPQINIALPFTLVLVGLAWWLVHMSRAGLHLKFIRANASMAHVVGVPINVVTLMAVLLSGALSGLGGLVIVSGMEGRLTLGFYEGYGFSGVLIAFLARNDPLGAAIVAVLVAMLFVAGQSLQIFYQIPFSMVELIQAIIVMCVAASEFFARHRIHWHP